MNEGEIRQAAQMYALVAEMHSINSSIEGMKSENTTRESRGTFLYNSKLTCNRTLIVWFNGKLRKHQQDDALRA